MKLLLALALCCFASLPIFAAGNPLDTEGCADSPHFSRMPGYIITSCENNDFNTQYFPLDNNEDGAVQAVEGKSWKIVYYVNEAQPNSPLAIVRNYKNAVLSAGGSLVFINEKDWPRMTGKVLKGGSELWLYVLPYDEGQGIELHVVEKQAMKQDVTASAMLDSLNATGHIALQINFDTGKATIKDDSQPVLAQAVTLLKQNAALKLEIQGHTDNVGDDAANQRLSDERAAAVKTALETGGIAAARLSSKGYGETKPVAPNDTDAGRAQNRRVELVKM
jgi:outer membrane protein OmpA-like peptidoglycan-associated protein